MAEMILNDAGYTHLGTFRVESGELRVTDPCYCPTPRPGYGGSGLKHGEGILRVPALNGVWHLRARIIEDGSWGRRVAELLACHEGTIGHPVMRGEEEGHLFVDSGQMGVFDDGHFPREPEQFEYMDESSFYRQACGRTCSEDGDAMFGGCLSFGGLTSSGYGDGSYPGFVQTDSTGLAISISVEFIGEEDEEEFEDEDDGDDDDWDEDEEDDDDDEEEPDDDSP